MTVSLESFHHRFAIPGHVRFGLIQNGLPAVFIRNGHASATIALQGAQVLAYQPHGQVPVLWMSAHSRFEPGVPIRGGIPVCWPWFGAHPNDPTQPSHGLARLFDWEVEETQAVEDGSTIIVLTLRDSAETTKYWPYAFDLRLRVTVGATLKVELLMHHAGPEAAVFTSALHSYFTVSDTASISIHGLEGHSFIDTTTTPWRSAIQDGPIRMDSECDRIYLDTSSEAVIEDSGFKRRLRIAAEGSRSTVVWNPWIAKARRMPDFGDDEYRGMICLETVNATTDARRLPPDGRHRLATEIRTEPFSDPSC